MELRFVIRKISHKKTVVEVNETIKYVYPYHEVQTQREKQSSTILNNNVLAYDQILVNYYEFHSVPDTLSNKGLEMQLQDDAQSSKKYSTPEITVITYNVTKEKNRRTMQPKRSPCKIIYRKTTYIHTNYIIKTTCKYQNPGCHT